MTTSESQMPRIVGYKIVSGSQSQVEREVNQLLSEGWSLLGKLRLRPGGGSDVLQVMMKLARP